MVIELAALVGGPLCPRFNGRGEVSLARSWLGRIHDSIRRYDPDATHHDRVSSVADGRQRSVTIGNRLELDVEALLAAAPGREVGLVYEGVVALKKEV